MVRAMVRVGSGVVRRSDRVFHGVAAVLLASVFAASFLQLGRPANPSSRSADYTICLLRRTTGLPCATCGMTRSFWALGRGAVGEAFRLHPLGPPVFVLLGFLLVRSAGIALTGRTWMERTARLAVWSLPFLAGAALVWWAARLAWMFQDGSGGAAWWVSPLGRLLSGG